jgi:hypothetical protein
MQRTIPRFSSGGDAKNTAQSTILQVNRVNENAGTRGKL